MSRFKPGDMIELAYDTTGLVLEVFPKNRLHLIWGNAGNDRNVAEDILLEDEAYRKVEPGEGYCLVGVAEKLIERDEVFRSAGFHSCNIHWEGDRTHIPYRRRIPWVNSK